MLKKYWDHDLTFSVCALFLLLIFINIAALRPVLTPLRPTLVVGLAAFVLLLFKGIRREMTISLGPAKKSIPTSPKTSRFASWMNVFPGPTTLSTRGIVLVP